MITILLIVLISDCSFEIPLNSSIIISLQIRSSSASYDPLVIAKNSGNWLLNQTYYDLEGNKWPEYQNSTDKNNYTGMSSGLCGIGYFLLELYQQTHDNLYLWYSEKGANWLINNAIEENGGYKWEQKENTPNYFSGWSHGVAGVGCYFLELYYATLNSSYLEIARKAGEWLISEAIQGDSGYKWNIFQGNNNNYTGWDAGAAGIGNFFIRLYKINLNVTYLRYAEGAAQWLISIAIPENGGYKWPLYESSAIYSTELGAGAAGIGNFFLELYRTTQNSTYLQYAESAAKWLISLAIPENNGYKIPIYQGTPSYYTGLSMGVAGIGFYFAELFNQTKNVLYKNYTQGIARWLLNIAFSINDSYFWPDRIGYNENFTGLARGVAGIGIFLIQIYSLFGNQTYYQYINGIVQWLLSQVSIEDNGFKWPQSDKSSKFYTHWNYGGAGIGYFFLLLYRLEYQPSTPTNGNDLLLILILSVISVLMVTLIIFIIYKKTKKKKRKPPRL
ncbi:MAG: lanthionine synthetase LanC family protein [Candidatus Helarchaeota archaeon]